MPALNHAHTYKRMKGRKGYYMCLHPDCSHYARVETLENKRATCSRCGKTYILTNAMLQLQVPHCDDCTNSPKARAKKAIREGNLSSENILNAMSAVLGGELNDETN